MKKLLALSISAVAVIVGCTRETPVAEQNSADRVTVAIEAGIVQTVTKAACDTDGFAKKVNHWVMEVLDKDGNVFTRQERNNVAEGTLTQTFNVTFFKNGSYNILFWADTKGAYKTDSLTAVSVVDTVANKDTRDAFSTCKAYVCTKNEKVTATLKRPFAQLNIQTTDLPDLWTTTRGESDRTEYDRFAPDSLQAVMYIPSAFNVKTQEVSKIDSVTLFTSSAYTGYQTDSTTLREHNNFYDHLNPATLFMDYIFAGSETGLYDITFSFKSYGEAVKYKFTSIPLQRNFRTNIKGKLMSHDTEWTVTINPDWYGEFGIDN